MTPKARVLVVDNDPWIPRMASTILGQAGYLVNVAGDAQGALASALKAPPNVILSTVTLPAVDGQPWWERLRSLTDGHHTPVIFLTGPGSVAGEIRGFSVGIDECLPKPFRVEELERAVRVVLARAPDLPVGPPDDDADRATRPASAMKPSHWHRPLSAFRGVLGEIGLPSLLVMLEMERKSGILVVEADEGTARFFLRRGYVIRAEVDGDGSTDTDTTLSGAFAVYEAVGWSQGHFEFLVGDVGGVDEIQATTTFLLMEGARRADESKHAKGGS